MSSGEETENTAVIQSEEVFAEEAAVSTDAQNEVASEELQAVVSQEEVPQNAAPQDVEEAAPEKPVNPNLQWYVVNAFAGFEAKAKKSLDERIRSHGLEKYFGDVYVPEETVVELIKGEKKTSTRKFFPGYMLVQMEMNQDTWHLVKETPKISGFIGDATDPSPLSEEEVARVLSQVEEGAAAPKSRITFTEGEAIKVIDGPFAEFSGTVEEVRPDKGKVRVLVSIFGRATPLDLDFVQVEKIS